MDLQAQLNEGAAEVSMGGMVYCTASLRQPFENPVRECFAAGVLWTCVR
jgi:hypothetical protein